MPTQIKTFACEKNVHESWNRVIDEVGKVFDKMSFLKLANFKDMLSLASFDIGANNLSNLKSITKYSVHNLKQYFSLLWNS